jgi:protein arginine N-methyltransferase 1
VYAIEKKDIIEMAKELSKVNNLQERVQFLRGSSKTVNLPEKVDMIVTEMFWSLFVSRGTMGDVKDAADKFLKDKGRIMPEALRIYLSPVSNKRIYDEVLLGSASNLNYGIDFMPAKKMAINNLHQRFFKREDLLSSPAVVREIDLMNMNLEELPVDWRGSFISSRSGIVHGLAGWMDLQLTEDIVLSNSPSSASTVWENIFFPVDKPLEVSEGDVIDVILRTIPFENEYEWSWDIILNPPKSPQPPFYKGGNEGGFNKGGIRGISRSQSTFKGFPVTKDFFKKKTMDYAPALSPDAEITKAILDLFDGKKMAKDIAEDIQKRFPRHFKAVDDALGRVEKIIDRYSR